MINLERRIKRLKGQLAKLEQEHCGNEINYTYWGGWSKGYLEGKISVLEDLVDDQGSERDHYDTVAQIARVMK